MITLLIISTPGGQRASYKQVTAETKSACVRVRVCVTDNARYTYSAGGRRRQLLVPNPCLVLGRNNDPSLKTIVRLSFVTAPC
jgi:hypothetical protein